MQQTKYSQQHQQLKPGSLGPHLSRFVKGLKSTGYKQHTLNNYIGSISHFGWWLDNQGILVEEIEEATVKAFGMHRCTCPGNRKRMYVSNQYLNRVKQFVNYLQRQGVVKSGTCKPGISQPYLKHFCDWLNQNRGLSKVTIDKYDRIINTLLPTLGKDPNSYNAKKIRQVVLKEVCKCSRPQAKTIITALRSYLRFLSAEGQCNPCLVNAVPTVPEWRLSSLPRYIDADSIDRLIDSCDMSTPHGVRDRAVLLLLARLGLRTGDIVSMRIDDLDWAEGTLHVRGKGRREVQLPLPQDVGDAILKYLEDIRPKVPIDNVFLCVNAPYRPFTSSTNVSDIVRLALCRAGIENPPSRGAHLLRHSAATMMLRSGVTLDAVSAVLRHRSPDMTANYAKVDMSLLTTIAQPWPGGDPC